MGELSDQLQTALQGTYDTTAKFLPQLISAIVLLLVGWIIARALKWALYKVLKAVKFDNLADKVGINGYLAKGGLKTGASGIIAKLGYWIVMLTVLILFFNTLGLESVSGLLQDVIKFIPNIIVACILLIVGMYLAEFVSGLVVAALKGGDFDNPNFVGRIAYGAVMFFTVAIVMNQLGIAEDLVNNVVGIILGGLGLATAIAFGLGGRDWAGRVINKYTKIN